jgi:hypothetical protein
VRTREEDAMSKTCPEPGRGDGLLEALLMLATIVYLDEHKDEVDRIVGPVVVAAVVLFVVSTVFLFLIAAVNWDATERPRQDDALSKVMDERASTSVATARSAFIESEAIRTAAPRDEMREMSHDKYEATARIRIHQGAELDEFRRLYADCLDGWVMTVRGATGRRRSRTPVRHA